MTLNEKILQTERRIEELRSLWEKNKDEMDMEKSKGNGDKLSENYHELKYLRTNELNIVDLAKLNQIVLNLLTANLN